MNLVLSMFNEILQKLNSLFLLSLSIQILIRGCGSQDKFPNAVLSISSIVQCACSTSLSLICGLSYQWLGKAECRECRPLYFVEIVLLFKRNFVALLINQSSMVYKHSNTEHFIASEWWWYLSFFLIDYLCLGNIPWSEVECVTIFLVLLELLSLFFPFSIVPL